MNASLSFVALFVLAMFSVFVGCKRTTSAPPAIPITQATARHEVVAAGLVHPWGLAFLPEGRMLVTERGGRLRFVGREGTLSAPVIGVPDVEAVGQGGMLDVALDPAFETNGYVYLSYSESAGDERSRTAVGRGSLSGAELVDFEVLFRQHPPVDSSRHFGSRLVFAGDGSLYITLGDRGERYEAQEPGNTLGTVVRINTDGTIPDGNPFGPASEVYTYGHRNSQGASLHPATGVLWTVEHGPQGGDEVNIIKAGKNYGWPVVTYGVEYGTGFSIGEGVTKPGMEDPIHVWVPSIAPGGMTFYTGGNYQGWEGSLFVTALKAELVARLSVVGDKVVAEERLTFEPSARIRHVVEGPDGYLYLLTDEEEGEIRRVL